MSEPVGTKTVEKIWGKEIWHVNDITHSYCHKKLLVKKGAGVSLHAHPVKCETFTLEKGKIQLTIEEEDGEKKIIMYPGDSRTIFPLTYHSFCGFVDSEITEVSTFHSDGDVLRKWGSYVNPILYAIDIDGTLKGSDTNPGIIEKRHLEGKDYVIVSSRSRARSKEVCDSMGIDPLAIYACRVVGRAEEMRRVDRDFLMRPTVYVGDALSDKVEAELAGWDFLFPHQFVSSYL